MGLASSQARLLSLTVRQHSIENRAQYLQAQKLRLSNESDAVYAKYINALDSTKLETRFYDKDGKVHWVDGSYNNLTKNLVDDKASGTIYYVQDINDGLLYQPKNICDAYNAAGGDIFKFFDSLGVNYIKNAHTEEYIQAEEKLKLDIANGWNVPPYTAHFREQYTELKSNILNPPETDTYRDANFINSIALACKNSNSSDMYLSTNNKQFTELKNYLNNLKSTKYYTGDMRTIIDYCLNFNISSVFNTPDNVDTLTAVNITGDKQYIGYSKATEQAKKTEEAQKVDDQFKLSMLLNGGAYKVNNGALTNIYSDSIKTTLNNFTSTEYATMGDALLVLSQKIMEGEHDSSKASAEGDLNALLATQGVDYQTVETALSNYNKYREDLAAFNAQSPQTYTKYLNQVDGLYHEKLFYAIQSAGGCKEISAENAKSPTWVGNMIKNAQVVLGIYDEQNKEIDNVTPSSHVGIREISNDDEIAQADSEYEASLTDINSKETKYQTELNQLEEERSAIQTEIESLKQIAKDNIASTFKTFT